MKKFQNEFEASKRELLDGKYLEYDPEWKKLFTWLRDNITIDNYVSPSMEENVKNHEFDDEIDTIEEDFPGIFEVVESDVKDAEAQLNVLLKAEGEYREQNDQLRKIINQVNEDIREISKELTDTYAQAEIWGEKVAGLEAQLESLTAQKDDSQKKLMEMYKNPEEVLAVGHIPIDYLKMNMEIAWKRLGTCMAAFNTEGSAFDGQRLSGRIEYFAESSLVQYEKLLQVQENFFGMQKAIEMFDGFTDFSSSSTEIGTQMAEMERKTNIYEAQMDELTTECMLGKKQELMKEKEQIYTKIHEVKLSRAQNRLEKLQEIDGFAEKFIDIAEILWILLQIDGKRIKNFLCVLEKGNPSQIGEFLWRINEDLKMTTFKISPPKPRKFLLDPNRNVQITEKFTELRSLEKALKSLILGPANTPIFMSPKLTLQQYILRNLAAQLDATQKDIKDRFTKEYLEPKASNKLWESRRLLWVWFLTQPKNVLMAIQAAARTPSKKSIKGLPGIRSDS